jgi:dTMP kinase
MGQRKKRKGCLITFEGGEGAGKSTQIRHLVQWLGKKRIPHILTLEPGGTRIGRGIRDLLLNPENKHLSNRAELLLYQADRAQHTDEIVLPALSAGKTVVSDRFFDSSVVYQGICRGLGLDWTLDLSRYATGGISPDLTLVLDIPPEKGLARVRKRFVSDPKLKGKRRRVKLDRLEREKLDFHTKVRKGFLQLARRFPSRIKVIDALMPEEEVRAAIEKLVGRKLKLNG